jgi:hypothetical protein
MTFSLTWLPQVLEGAGLKISLVPGWENRGRGEMGEVLGVICHHTGVKAPGNMPTLGALTNGRAASPGAPALAGPLSQLGLGRDGTFYVIAAGRANHAGAGTWQGISTGNTNFIGIEAEHSGDPNDAWPDAQLDAYRRGVAAILRFVGRSAEFCCGHKEYAPKRKDDPVNIDMNVFRADVASLIGGSIPMPIPIAAVDAKGRRTLRRGDSGPDVTKLHAALNMVGFPAIFGPQTEAKVRAFQREKQLVPDGIVGPDTWAALLISAQSPSATGAQSAGTAAPPPP